MGAVHVARPQGAALDIPELVEHEQRMVTGTGKVAVVGAAFLLAVATFRRKKPFSDDRATNLGARTRRQVTADKL
jgi:hypothetical protein